MDGMVARGCAEIIQLHAVRLAHSSIHSTPSLHSLVVLRTHSLGVSVLQHRAASHRTCREAIGGVILYPVPKR